MYTMHNTNSSTTEECGRSTGCIQCKTPGNGMQVFLAMPADCPVEPSGAKRNTPASATGRNSVSMYISDDEALTFNQVSCMPLSKNCLAEHALLDCLCNSCLMWLRLLAISACPEWILFGAFCHPAMLLLRWLYGKLSSNLCASPNEEDSSTEALQNLWGRGVVPCGPGNPWMRTHFITHL